MSSMKIYSQPVGKKNPKTSSETFFFSFIRKPLEKVVQKEMEGIFSLCGFTLYFGMLAIQDSA